MGQKAARSRNSHIRLEIDPVPRTTCGKFAQFCGRASYTLHRLPSRFVAFQDSNAGVIARRELLGEFALAHADKLGELFDVALVDSNLGDAAAIRALRAVDLGFNLLAEAPQAPVRMAMAFQISTKARVLASLLVFEAANLDEIGNHLSSDPGISPRIQL
jgi:hypothetical protein